MRRDSKSEHRPVLQALRLGLPTTKLSSTSPASKLTLMSRCSDAGKDLQSIPPCDQVCPGVAAILSTQRAHNIQVRKSS